MLFKGGSDTATVVGAFATDTFGLGDAAPESEASAAQDAHTGLQAENENLRARLHLLEGELPAELAQARAQGRNEAKAEHVRNDEAQLAALSAALIAARDSFVAQLGSSSQTLAARLAGAALQQLVAMRRDEEDWLLRIVARRLADLDAASVVALVLPETLREVAEQLQLQPGTAVVFDPSLSASSARITLTMGGIPIRVEEGLARLSAVLDPEFDVHG